ncbi:MAG: hypothetical protein HYZ33_03910 [Ignavibacteriales bacterium]|nr:hypothetical protein [Ignavibacteriales bacterium]
MNHIDQLTLELFVLGSEQVSEQRKEIETHLLECHGCKELADEMLAFRKELELTITPQEIPVNEYALAKPRYEIILNPDTNMPIEVYRQPTTMLEKFRYFVRKHPVVTTGSTTMAGVFASLLYFSPVNNKDMNPFDAVPKSREGNLEVINKDLQTIWSIPSLDLQTYVGKDVNDLKKQIIVTDMNFDQRNEVITTFGLGNDVNPIHTIKIFSHKQTLENEIKLSEQITFRGQQYSDLFSSVEIFSNGYESAYKKEIIVRADNFRSPNMIARLDNEGNVIGKYIHFGAGRITEVKNVASVANGILFFGQNDIGEEDSLTNAVLAFLDISKLKGVTESSGSRGFGLPTSESELYYIRFPLSDMHYLWNTKNTVTSFELTLIEGKRFLKFWVRGQHNYDERNPMEPSFEYLFNENFQIVKVNYNSTTLNARKQLVLEGKLTGTFDEEYLNNLKNGVRYWDGREWRSEVTRVVHREVQ